MDEAFIDTPGYAWFWFIFRIILTCVLLSSHVVLLRMGAKIQSILRSYGHIEGYRTQCFCIAMYIVYLGKVLHAAIRKPIILFLVAISDFTCSDSIKQISQVFYLWSKLSFPFAY